VSNVTPTRASNARGGGGKEKKKESKDWSSKTAGSLPTPARQEGGKKKGGGGGGKRAAPTLSPFRHRRGSPTPAKRKGKKRGGREGEKDCMPTSAVVPLGGGGGGEGKEGNLYLTDHLISVLLSIILPHRKEKGEKRKRANAVSAVRSHCTRLFGKGGGGRRRGKGGRGKRRRLGCIVDYFLKGKERWGGEVESVGVLHT